METKAKLRSKALGRWVVEAKDENERRQYSAYSMALLLLGDWIILETIRNGSANKQT
jgi:hypothetical protein